MTQDITIPQIANYLLRNSNSINSTGLYNGKAGISLSLFIASGYLLDEHLEDVAYHMLQESLIIKNNDISFENGWAGIGYALLYLIEKKYLEADFDELFGEQYEYILKSNRSNIENDPLILVNTMRVVYFLSKVRTVKKEDSQINELIKKIFEGLEFFLSIQFHDFDDIRYIRNKSDVLNIYQTYLKLIDYSGYAHFSHVVLDDYAALYRKGKIASSLETGHYLKLLADKNSINGFEDVICDNIKYGNKNIYPSFLSLKERIDLGKLINNDKSDDPLCINNYEDLKMQDLLNSVDDKSNPLGYGTGLGRFLLYCIDKDIELL